jgi:hypothetical protein
MFPHMRQLEQCIARGILETPFNNNLDSPSFTGFAFDLQATTIPVSLTTLQLDVRLDLAQHELGVQVYARQGFYESFLNDTTAWTLVADTDLVPNPIGNGVFGAIIPVQDFNVISMGVGERWSLYVSLQGPWLDYTANAYDSTGDIAFVDKYLEVHTGVGITDLAFSNQIDFSVSPTFAGVVYYQTNKNCPANASNTTLQYHFVVENTTQSNVDDAISGQVDAFVNEELTTVGGLLYEYGLSNALHIGRVTETLPADFTGTYSKHNANDSYASTIANILTLCSDSQVLAPLVGMPASSCVPFSRWNTIPTLQKMISCT